MVALRRIAVGVALAALLLAGAAGLSGGLEVGECLARVEGTSVEDRTRWWPPGRECVERQAVAGGWEPYAPLPADAPSGGGSVPAFLGVLAAGALIWLLFARSRPPRPAPLRMAAATALAFALFGAGSWLAGPFPAGPFLAWLFGVPLALLVGGLPGAAVAALAVLAAATGLLLGLGLGAFAIVLAAVVLAAAALSTRGGTRTRNARTSSGF